MFRRLNHSSTIARLMERFTTALARRRGLPILIGVVMIAIAFVFQIMNLMSPSSALEWGWAIFLHIGILIALIGVLLVEPLGR